jgi:hypothetical protein
VRIGHDEVLAAVRADDAPRFRFDAEFLDDLTSDRVRRPLTGSTPPSISDQRSEPVGRASSTSSPR